MLQFFLLKVTMSYKIDALFSKKFWTLGCSLIRLIYLVIINFGVLVLPTKQWWNQGSLCSYDEIRGTLKLCFTYLAMMNSGVLSNFVSGWETDFTSYFEVEFVKSIPK